MGRRHTIEHKIFKNVEITDAGSEGKAVARIEDKVIFVPFVVPGDIIDVQLTKKKKSYMEGKAVKIHKHLISELKQNVSISDSAVVANGKFWTMNSN